MLRPALNGGKDCPEELIDTTKGELLQKNCIYFLSNFISDNFDNSPAMWMGELDGIVFNNPVHYSRWQQ